jgi:hypothetical protein
MLTKIRGQCNGGVGSGEAPDVRGLHNEATSLSLFPDADV